MDKTAHIWGELSDLDALEKYLNQSGVERQHEDYVKASSHPIIATYLIYMITTQAAKCIKHYLTMKHQKMITRESHGERITITGDQSIEHIKAALEKSHGYNLLAIPPGKVPASLSGGPHNGHIFDVDEGCREVAMLTKVLQRNGEFKVVFEAKYILTSAEKPFVFEFVEK